MPSVPIKVILYLLLLTLCVFHSQADDNLIANPSFEEWTGQLPDGWGPLAGSSEGAVWTLSTEHPYRGSRSLHVTLPASGWAALAQRTAVKPSTFYTLSLGIRTDQLAAGGPGAHIHIPEANALSNDFSQTSDGWQTAVLLLKTDPGQTELTVAARVGTTAQPARGRAWFDLFRLEETGSRPPVASVDATASTDIRDFPRPGWALALFALLMTGLLIVFILLGKKRRWLPAGRWRDVILAGGLTLACGIISFSHLGSFDTPQTYYQGRTRGEHFILDLDGETPISEVRSFLALGAGSYRIDFSADGKIFEGAALIEQKHTFSMIEWRSMRPEIGARYVRVTTEKPGALLGELALFGADRTRPLPAHVVNPPPAGGDSSRPATADPRRVCDEPGRVPLLPGYLNGMYFDECYHARSAYEYVRGRDATETSHPPLGKLTISAGILLFGFTPFGWRFMGALFGVLMVPLLYALTLSLFKKSEAAFLAAFLLACDFMRFTQSRIATIDVFAVFWILATLFFLRRALAAGPMSRRPRRFFRNLALSGLCLGMGAATKWIVLYAAAGLAAIFVISYIAKAAAMFKRGVRTEEGDDESGVGPWRALADRVRFLAGRTASVFIFSLLVFVMLPATVYVASYIPFMAARGPIHPDVSPLQLVIDEQVAMYTYHAGLTATHAYSSSWYEWPLMTRPLWYYTGRAVLPASSASDIYAFGNPVVWWTGTAAALGLTLSVLVAGFLGAVFLLRRLLEKKLRPDTDEPEGGTRTDTRLLRRMAFPGLFILAALAAQYVPWIVNPRKLTFIYHFFASVPFIILCLVHVVGRMIEGRPRLRWAALGLMAGALLLFILFYPLLSGALVDTSYVETFLRWFPGWFQYL